MSQLYKIINEIKKMTFSPEEVEKLKHIQLYDADSDDAQKPSHTQFYTADWCEMRKKIEPVFDKLLIFDKERDSYAGKVIWKLKRMAKKGLVGCNKLIDHSKETVTDGMDLENEPKIKEGFEKMGLDYEKIKKGAEAQEAREWAHENPKGKEIDLHNFLK